VRDTCIGEHNELIPFLGSSILSDPVDSFKANLVLHGHAHNGMEKGKTLAGIPVRNVALPVHHKKYALYDTEMFLRKDEK
jgi:Icc-related predicted phosphoesterase